MIYPTNSHSEFNEHPTHITCGTETIHNRLAIIQVLDRTLDLCIQGGQVTVVGLHLDLSRQSDSNHDNVPRRQSRGVILESHWGIQPWNLLKYPEKIGAIESKINLHLVPSCVSDTRWSHRSSNLTLTSHGGSSLKIRPGPRIFCRRGYFLCISISRSLSCWRRLHRTNV